METLFAELAPTASAWNWKAALGFLVGFAPGVWAGYQLSVCVARWRETRELRARLRLRRLQRWEQGRSPWDTKI